MDLATIQIKVDTREVKAANDDIANLGKTGKQVGKDVSAANDNMAQSARSTTSAFKLLGGAMAALGVGALVSNFARTVTESERLKGSLKTMTGSTEDAAFAFAELEKFASQTPFTLDQSVEGFIKLKALGLDPSERALRSYGNTSAAMGKDMMQMIEAVADASTGEFERLKEFGIKASKSAGQVSLTFQGLTTTIGDSSQEIQEYLLNIGETKFGSAMEDQMKALPGLLSNLEDNISALFRKIGDVGGINLFATAISGASALVIGITNNLDLLATGLAAAMAGFIAFTVGSNASAILGGFGKMKAAVLALNTAIKANPIGFIASAIAIAATAIIMNWDKIKVAAEKAAIYTEMAFQELKIFLLGTFAAAIDKIGDGFTNMKNDAIASMYALAAAVKNPTSAIDTFNETFDTTLASLKAGQDRTGLFSESISASRDRVRELNERLSTMNTEVIEADDNYQDAGRSLSDYAVEVDKNAVAANELAQETKAAQTKALELLGVISNETEALHMSNLEIDIRNNLQKVGVDATSELGEQIIAATTQLHNEKQAIKEASEAAKQLEMDNAAAQKAIEEETKRVAEEAARAYEAMKTKISGFFMDVFENGLKAFDNIAKTFKNMILQMLADWAASKIADIMTGTFSGIGNSISGMFSGIFSSIGSSIAGLASRAASVLTGGAIGGGAAAAGAAGAGAAGAAAGAAGAGAAGAAAGGGIIGTISGGISAAGSAIASGASAVGSAALSVLTNPLTLALGAAALIAKKLDSGGTPTSNVGMLLTDLPAVPANRKFDVAPFESGISPVGFIRNGGTRQDAESVIDAFRAVDTSIMELARASGKDFKLSGSGITGFDENGRNTGLFFGLASEEGKLTSMGLEAQLRDYAVKLVSKAHEFGLVGDDAYRQLSQASSAKELIELGAKMVSAEIDGSHRDGLDMVPYDGYVAELHAGERVQTAEQARASDSVAEEMSGLRQSIEDVMVAVARNTSKLYRLNDRWDKNGLPPVRA